MTQPAGPPPPGWGAPGADRAPTSRPAPRRPTPGYTRAPHYPPQHGVGPPRPRPSHPNAPPAPPAPLGPPAGYPQGSLSPAPAHYPPPAHPSVPASPGQPAYQRPGYGPPSYREPAPPPADSVSVPIVAGGVGKRAARNGARRALVFSRAGLCHRDRQAGDWELGWSEIGRIVITRAYHQGTGMFAPKTWRIRLVFDAADLGFLHRHPDFVTAQGRFGASGQGSFGVPLGPAESAVDPLVRAFAEYGRTVFGGVLDEGRLLGLGYL